MARDALGVLLLAALVALGWRQAPPVDPGGLALCGLGVVVCLFEVRRPGIGFFSVSPALFLAAGLVGQTRLATVAALLALALRSFLTGFPQPLWRAREALCDALAILAPLAVLGATPGSPGWLRSAVALQAYLVAALWLSRGLSQALPPEQAGHYESSWAQLTLPTVLVGCLGLALGDTLESSPRVALWIAVALVAVRLQATPFVLAAERSLRRQAESELGSEQSRRARIEGELQEVQDAYQTAVQLGRMLGACQTLQSTADALVGFVHARLESSSVVLFMDQEPLAFRTPRAAELRDSTLLDLREPLVEQACQTGRICRRSGGGSPLFPLEPEALAWPLQGFGALYVGGARALSPREAAILGLVVQQGGWALESVRRREDLEVSGQHLARSNRRLNDWLGNLDRLVEGLRTLSTELDRDRLLDLWEDQLEALVPHDFRLLQVDGQVRAHPASLTRFEELGEAVMASGRPLMLEQVSQSRFAPMVEGEHAVLVLPLVSDATRGFFLLGRTRTGAFRRQDQHLLDVLAYQLGLALGNARLHAELARSYLELQESQAQLVQSSKLAAVGQLAAGVAHELNTPLASSLLSIQGAQLNLTRNAELAPAKLKLAEQELRRAQEIVSNLLSYSRDARGGRRSCHLQELIRETLTLLGGQTGRVAVRLELPEEDLELTCNPSEIKQVLINLMMNGLDAVDPAAGEVVVRARREPGWIALQVQDNGSGMSPEVQARACDPFFTTKPVGKGTGLGLSVSSRLVAAHQGQLLMQSREGAGTVMTLRLPTAPSGPGDTAPAGGSAAPP